VTFVRLKTPPGVLGEIVDRTRRDVVARLHNALPQREGSVRDFAHALRESGSTALIAEFKPKSPSRGTLTSPDQIESYASLYSPYAAAMSVLTDAPYFGGSPGLLQRARAHFPGPILRKDFIVSPFQIEEAHAWGADAILLMASLLPLQSLELLLASARDAGMSALVEVHNQTELEEAVEAGARVIGVNSRDLHTLEIDLCAARALAERVPTHKITVAESGLRTRADIASLPGNVDAVLIGTALVTAPDPRQAILDMGFAPCR
jgi:indole-3-glycerol phosphate synthase